MGYYSDCYFELQRKDKTPQEIIEEVKEGLKSKGKTLKDLFYTIHVNEDRIIFEARNIKWYTEYPHIQWFMDYVDDNGSEIEENDLGFVHYVRIGGDIEDIVEVVYGDYTDTDLEIVRKVEIANWEQFDGVNL